MRKAFIATFLALFSLLSFAQQPPVSLQNLSSVKVDDLSDDQIIQFWNQLKSNDVSMDKLEDYATQKKMPPAEYIKLKLRLEKLSLAGTIDIGTSAAEKSKEGEKTPSTKDQKDKKDKDIAQAFNSFKPKVFGSDLFNNKYLTFEPNLKISTPMSYKIGPDDELIIDVFGASEANYKLKVHPDGNIRIPNFGVIDVNGLTMDQATKRISGKLSSIFSGITTGESKVNITIGNIRSIKVILTGEINLPGTYTLPSLATVFNALYVSGGPNDKGSFRNIKLIRDGKVIQTIDVYEFIAKGTTPGNIQLQDQDIVKVPAYENRVELKGEVKTAGLFEVIKGETLKDIISYSGGYTDNAYTDRFKVIRITPKERSVGDIEGTQAPSYKPLNGDTYFIGKLLERYTNRVHIYGAVFRPGFFALEDGLTLKKLIEKADGVKEDALVTRAIISRIKDDNSREVLSFNVKEVLAGTGDITLKREDSVVIASKIEMRDLWQLTINGDIQKPGKYNFAEHMSVEDLIILAGGLKESASEKVEIYRRMKNADPSAKNSQIATLLSYTINKELTHTGESIYLEPFDEVSVYPSPAYVPQRNISIEGEVLFPGVYVIEKKSERISEVIKRAGGFTSEAFPEGAVLIRKMGNKKVDEIVRQNKIEAIAKQSTDTNRLKETIRKEETRTNTMVAFDLKKAMTAPGSFNDVILEENDIISVPKTLQTVQVSGEVLYPVKLRFEKSKGYNYYVHNAGGYSSKALKRRAYVVYANGTAASTKRFLWFNSHPEVLPGSEIFVPAKEVTRKATLGEVLGLTSTFVTLGVLVLTYLKK